MRVKKAGGYIYGADLTAAERKALEMESKRMLAEYTRLHEIEMDAIIIRQLKRMTGWDESQLKTFYQDFNIELDRLLRHYEMGEDDAAWLCTRELKLEGIDIEQWRREVCPNERHDIFGK